MSNRIFMNTPQGVAVFPKLNKPDFKFDDRGVYSVEVKLNPDDEGVQEFLDELSELYDLALDNAVLDLEAKEARKPKSQRKKVDPKKIKRASSPIRPVTDDEGEKTGEVTVRAKMYASYKNKQTDEIINRNPALFNAAGQPISDVIGGGSIITVNFEASPFYTSEIGAGISLRLRAVQVLERKAFGESAEDFGFAVQEDAVEVVDAPAEDDGEGGDPTADF